LKTTNVVQDVIENEGVSDEALEMSIDESSSVFLMDALGKLYSQPARAALREYLANGIDAHVEAGGKRPPIEVTLPSSTQRTLSIRDYGNGMSEDNFNNILRRYGASTKRHSNKLTGGFGLGAKAGFALTDSFHMTSYQSGRLTKVRIFKNAGGKGFIEVVDRATTKQADGMLVEVEIPVGNVDELSYASLVTDKFFSAYSDSEITVTACDKNRNAWGTNREEMKRVPVEEVSLHNPENYEPLEYGGAVVGWVGKKRAPNSPVRAIIGRVSYEVKRDTNGYGQTYSYSTMTGYSDKFGPAMPHLNKFEREVVLNLPIGSVDLPSSREEITYSERSMKTLIAVSTSVHRMVEEKVQRMVNAKETAHEALCEIVSLHSADFWKAEELLWRGKKAPITKKAANFSEKSDVVRYLKTGEVRQSLTVKMVTDCHPSEINAWHDDKRIQTVMITAADNDEYNLATKKIKTNIADFHKAQEGSNNVQVLLFPTVEPLAEWLAHGKKMTLDEFIEVGKVYRAEKRAAAKAVAKAQGGNPAFGSPVKTTATTREIFHVPVNRVVNGNSVHLTGTPEHALLSNQSDFYYLSKAEVKDVSAELSMLFPTRQGSGATAYIDSSYSRLLPTLKEILGENAKLVFVPATRNMEEFNAMYPNVPSVITAIKNRLQNEWNQVESGNKTDTYLSEIFWLANNRNKVSLINQFFRALTPGESVSMNADLLEIHSYMDSTSRVANSRMHILVGELMGVDFREKITRWMQKKITVVGNRYPILTMMNPVGSSWDELKPEMIRYLKTC
jgi:hypothetical protein